MKSFKEPFVIILVGHPLCGKSTWINENYKNTNVTIISRDNIIMKLHGSSDYTKAYNEVNQKEVDSLLLQDFKDCAAAHVNVIVDMTNMTSKRRKQNLSYFGNNYTKVCVVFPILDESEFIRRNDIRTIKENKHIPLNAIHNMIKSFQVPTKEEGFHEIISIPHIVEDFDKKLIRLSEERKNLTQDVIDRHSQYGDDYKRKLDEFNKQFPATNVNRNVSQFKIVKDGEGRQ
jgi:predicted kinase